MVKNYHIIKNVTFITYGAELFYNPDKNLLSEFKNIKFVGGIYNYSKLSSLRWYAKLYFHGHSVGGTNPSLLEAMASNAYIAAHDNPFNRYVLGDDAFYFSNSNDIINILKNFKEDYRNQFTLNNREKIKSIHNWEKVSKSYLNVFESILNGR